MSAVERPSRFNKRTPVRVDPWSTNALYEDAQQSVPHLVKAAQASQGEAPTMFATGDLPPFTASGIDPSMLRYLPWQMRHAAAEETDPKLVLQWIETYHDEDPNESLPSEGLAKYEARMSGWLGGRWTNPAFDGQVDTKAAGAADDDLYDSLFGEDEKVRAERLANENAGYERRGTAIGPALVRVASGVAPSAEAQVEAAGQSAGQAGGHA